MATVLINAFSSLLTNLALFLPNLVGAIILFLLGLIFGNWLKKGTVKLLSSLQLSSLFKNSGLEKFLKKAEITTKIEVALGELVRFLIIIVFFIAAVNLLGLTTVTQVFNNILGYLPNVFAAAIILTLGVIVAGVVESLVKGSLGAVDIKMARLLAKISSYIVVIFTVLAAFSQLKIAAAFVNTLFIGFVAMLALGLGLSLGLGSKDLVKQVLEDWYRDFKKQTR